MKLINIITMAILLYACEDKDQVPKSSVEIIQSAQEQKFLFTQLREVFEIDTVSAFLNDSMSFLILPLQISCPSCRKKTIDSIMFHQNRLVKNKFTLIALAGGRKSANSYFWEQNYELPILTRTFRLDSTNQSFKKGLYKDQPMIYYAANQKVFKKVAARPSTVREDLREFFSGYRKYKEANIKEN
jgi:hypothetical protein